MDRGRLGGQLERVPEASNEVIGAEQTAARNHTAQRHTHLSEGRSGNQADFSLYPDPLAVAGQDTFQESDDTLNGEVQNRRIFASGIIGDPKSAGQQ